MGGLVAVGLAARGHPRELPRPGRPNAPARRFGVALATVGLFGLTNYLLTPKGSIELAWHSDEAAAVAEARASNRPLLVDFAASWCLPCKEFEVKVFSRPEVAEVMRGYTLLRVDLSHEDDDPTARRAQAKVRHRYAPRHSSGLARRGHRRPRRYLPAARAIPQPARRRRPLGRSSDSLRIPRWNLMVPRPESWNPDE